MQMLTAKYWNEVWNPMEELGEGLKELKGVTTPQVEQQCQLTWSPSSSQRLNYQPKGKHSWSEASGTYVAEAAFSGLSGRRYT